MSINKFDLFDDLSDEWIEILDNTELDNIISFLNTIDLNTISPKIEDLFNFARVIEPKDIIVCLLGQDPYPNVENAHGMSFSCLNGIPGSLLNIYKCLVKSKLLDKIPNTGDLTNLSEQGILLLNTSLTTQNAKSNSHKNLWKNYTDKILIDIVNYKFKNKLLEKSPLIFINWGNFAKNKIKIIEEIPHIYKLYHHHPSPNVTTKEPFYKCQNFIECNEILKRYDLTINYNLLNKKAKKQKICEESDSEESYSENSDSEKSENEEEENEDNESENKDENKDESDGNKNKDENKDSNKKDKKDKKDKKNKIKIVEDKKINLNTLILDFKSHLPIYERSDNIFIFTDGSFSKKNRPRGGYSYIVGNYLELNHFEGGTCQRAEGLAIKRSFEYINSLNLKKNQTVNVITDNKFWKDMYERFMPNWKSENVDFNRYKNPDITIPGFELYLKLTKTIFIKFMHIYSHGKSGWDKFDKNTFEYYCYYNNNFVDQMAKYARDLVSSDEILKIDISVVT